MGVWGIWELSGWFLRECLLGVWGVSEVVSGRVESGRGLESVWWGSGRGLSGVWGVSKGVWNGSRGCLVGV